MTTAVMGIGGLGHLAVQFLHAMGNRVAAFTTSPEKVDEIKKLGADEVIVVNKDYSSLKEHDSKFDVIVNTLPVSSLEAISAYMGTLACNGHLIQVGAPNVDT